MLIFPSSHSLSNFKKTRLQTTMLIILQAVETGKRKRMSASINKDGDHHGQSATEQGMSLYVLPRGETRRVISFLIGS